MITSTEIKDKFIKTLSGIASKEHPEGSFWADPKKRKLAILAVIGVLIVGISFMFPTAHQRIDRSKNEIQLATDDISGNGKKPTTVFSEAGADQLESINNAELLKSMETEMQNREISINKQEEELFRTKKEMEDEMDKLQLETSKKLREQELKHAEDIRLAREQALEDAKNGLSKTLASENAADELSSTPLVPGQVLPDGGNYSNAPIPAPSRVTKQAQVGIRVMSGSTSYRLGNGQLATVQQFTGDASPTDAKPATDIYTQLEQAKAALKAKNEAAYNELNATRAAKQAEEKRKGNLVPLTAGTILSGTLINGLYVPISSTGNNDPMPAIFRIKRDALMPNFNSSSEVVECIIVASSKAAVESIRVEFRASTLTCINRNGVATEDAIKAMSTGYDGSSGVQATLISRNSELLMRTAMAGFLQGLTDIFSQTSLEVNSEDGVYAVSGKDLTNLTGSAAIGGAGTALERLADYYMDLADKMMPTLHVKPGTQVDFIVTSLSVIDFNQESKK